MTPFLPPYSHYEAPCLYMEYIDGMTANFILDECGDVPAGIVRYLLWQLAKVSAEMMSKEAPAAGAVGIDSERGEDYDSSRRRVRWAYNLINRGILPA